MLIELILNWFKYNGICSIAFSNIQDQELDSEILSEDEIKIQNKYIRTYNHDRIRFRNLC